MTKIKLEFMRLVVNYISYKTMEEHTEIFNRSRKLLHKIDDKLKEVEEGG